MFGISPPRSTPSANERAPAAPQNVSVSGATKNSPSLVKPCVSTCAWLPCQTAVDRYLCRSLEPKIFERASVERLLTIWIVPTVAIEIGAGLVQLTIVPSGATSRIGRVTPSFHVTSQASSGKIGAKSPPQVAQYEQLTPSSTCGLEPVKSYVSVSASFVTVSSTLAFAPGMSMYSRTRHSPSASSDRRCRTSCSDWRISSSETDSTRSTP